MQEKAKGQASCDYRERANLMLMCIRCILNENSFVVLVYSIQSLTLPNTGEHQDGMTRMR